MLTPCLSASAFGDGTVRRLQVDHARSEREQAEPRLAAIEEQLATAQAELSEREKEASEYAHHHLHSRQVG